MVGTMKTTLPEQETNYTRTESYIEKPRGPLLVAGRFKKEEAGSWRLEAGIVDLKGIL
jgi:hypothetical protein